MEYPKSDNSIRQHGTDTISASARCSRLLSLLVVATVMFWASFWCLGLFLDFAMGTGTVGTNFDDEEEMAQYSYSIGGLRGGQRDSSSLSGTSDASDQDNALGSGIFFDNQDLSVHDLNVRAHMMKAAGLNLFNEDPKEIDNIGEQYLGEDSTSEIFYAGKTTERKRVVNEKGRIETISGAANTYASLPFRLDEYPFGLSLWVYLAPIEQDGIRDGILEDNRTPRVILSTRSGTEHGCYSDLFGRDKSAGIVIYAQPHYSDASSGVGSSHLYRVVVEHSSDEAEGTNLCRQLNGSTDDDQLLKVGEWQHIVLFFTQTSESGKQRLSLFVNGDISGQKSEHRHFPSPSKKAKTIVGRYETQNEGKNPSEDHFYLDGRVGMLSYWQTGGPNTYSIAPRLVIKSEEDEEHVVNAINRAAFDVQAIQELSLTGLTVQEPTLLYPFDRRNETESSNKLYDDEPQTVPEKMTGRHGRILSVMISDGKLLNQKEPFVPLGPYRYLEYRDGSFVPPHLSARERQELDEIASARCSLVKRAMEHAWQGYSRYAFGKDELLPLSKRGQDNWGGMGTTLVDSLSTLWQMGMKEDFWKARDWVRDHLDFSKVKQAVSVFETCIRNLGGLLSAYDLSGDEVFLRKADDLGQRLIKAFENPNGIPFGEVELFEGGHASNTGWHANKAVLSEIGTLQIEFRYLAHVTGKEEYATKAMRALDQLLSLNAENGLYPTYIYNLDDLRLGGSDISLGAMGDSFYEYLLKVWLQGGRREMKYRRMYDKSIKGVLDKLTHMSRPNYLTYVAELKNGQVIHKMDHLSCFLGGNLALGAYTHPDGLLSREAQRQLKTGKQLAYTCYQMYAKTRSGLAPEFVQFSKSSGDDFSKGSAAYYILRPETAETFFILYHLTKDPIYREWSWELFQAIEEHCKTDAAYASIRNVDTMQKDDRMESFFLAETLKYLYLIQDNDNNLDLLDTHVFNTEAHPLRLLDSLNQSR